MPLSTRGGALAVAALAVPIPAAPAAHAAPGVCNQASPHWLGGGLVALDPPVNSPAARYTVDIGKLPGNGAGLFDAALKSPSLTICAPVVPPPPGDGGGGVVITSTTTGAVDVGTGVVDVVIN